MLRKLALWILGIKESDIVKDIDCVIVSRGRDSYLFFVNKYVADTMRGVKWRLIIDKSNKSYVSPIIQK